MNGDVGERGWYTSAVLVALVSSDALSGVAKTEYRIDAGAWQEYLAPFDVGSGRHIVEYRSVDAAGNIEAQKVVPIQIDEDAPMLVAQAPLGVQTASIVEIRWSASDALSGIDHFEVSVDGGGFQDVGTSTRTNITLSDGPHVVRVKAVDLAGNGDVAEVRVQVDTNVFSLSGPYAGAPTFATIGGVAAFGAAFAMFRRRQKRRRQ